MPRLFTALEIPASISSDLSRLQNGLENARWIEPVDFHLTLRFIGDVTNQQANELTEQLEHIQTPEFKLHLDGLDYFGKSKPHSLIVKIKKNETLELLQSKHERLCQRLGLKTDSRKFSPHITIARIGAVPIQQLAQYLSANGYFKSSAFSVNGFCLYTAKSSTGGGPYAKLQRYPFP